MRILITAPSLDEKRNVSGISTLVRQIIEHGRSDFSHFVAGREDGEVSGPKWLIKQALLPLRLTRQCWSFVPDVVHINTALTERSIVRDAALAKSAALAGRPVLLAVHGGKYLIDDIASPRLDWITQNMLRRSAAVVVYSDFEEQHLRRRWPDLRIRTLPNAIPLENIGLRPRSDRVPSLIYFGRMHESKGLHELIEACRSLKEKRLRFRLAAYGEGPIREVFVRDMQRVLGEDFQYGGIVSGSAKWDVLGQADIFVLPSRYGEGLPMAMLEAMATGCIAVASDVASVSSVIRDGDNGYLVEPYDSAGLAARLEALLADPTGWPSVREEAVATVRNDFEIESYIDKLEEIYSSVQRDSRK